MGSSPDPERLQSMNKALYHRGPDGNGIQISGNTGLGHTRLTIVDLQAGAQPMVTADQRYAITYNGEIYNYRELRHDLESQGCTFVTHSDTEVLLQLFVREGAACLHKLRGMFAFAIHDRHAGTVFLARDRFGIKPLFYAWDGENFIAASEMKAIFASGLVTPRFNLHSVLNYFTYQFAVTPHTLFQGVNELPPGHQVLLQAGREPDISCYWDIEFPGDDDYESMSEQYWSSRFVEAFSDAVQVHAIGDVPIGSYLSGGIDSAAIAWMLHEIYPEPLQTFSIKFTDPAEDESAIYQRIARHLKVANEELLMDDERAGGFVGDLEKCLYALEQPQRMAVDIPHFLLSGMVQSKNYKVVYTGDGSDELFGGYDCFRQDYMRFWGNQAGSYWQRLHKYFGEYTEWFSHDFIALLFDLHKPSKQKRVFEQWGTYPAWHDFWEITRALIPGLFTDDFIAANRDNQQMDQLRASVLPHLDGRHMLNQSLYIEAKTRLPGWILWKSDRLSMAHSVEARVPFMDHKLAEMTAKMPPFMKLNNMDEKYVLRKVAMPHLPEHPSGFKKKAFYTPIRAWFFTPEREVLLDKYLSSGALQKTGIFNAGRVRELLEILLAYPPARTKNEIFRIMQLEWILMLVLSVQILHAQFVGDGAGMRSS